MKTILATLLIVLSSIALADEARLKAFEGQFKLLRQTGSIAPHQSDCAHDLKVVFGGNNNLIFKSTTSSPSFKWFELSHINQGQQLESQTWGITNNRSNTTLSRSGKQIDFRVGRKLLSRLDKSVVRTQDSLYVKHVGYNQTLECEYDRVD